MNNIAIIIVFYHPSQEDISSAIELSKYYNGIIVDNSETECLPAKINKMTYLCFQHNYGIAKAQNIGIQSIQDFQYIVFLDQDSRINKDFPIDIINEYIEIQKKYNLAFLGPTIINKDNGEEYKSVIHKKKYIGDKFILRKNIISSGCCISREALKVIGLADESLFIDNVDNEWCWRAYQHGYICGLTEKIKLQHKIGNKYISIWAFKDIISSPFRYYYQYRNYLWLSRRKYVPLQWKILIGIKNFIRLIYFPICIKDFHSYYIKMLMGIKDGLKSQTSIIPKL
jgi:rhamnosyltransferase